MIRLLHSTVAWIQHFQTPRAIEKLFCSMSSSSGGRTIAAISAAHMNMTVKRDLSLLSSLGVVLAQLILKDKNSNENECIIRILAEQVMELSELASVLHSATDTLDFSVKWQEKLGYILFGIPVTKSGEESVISRPSMVRADNNEVFLEKPRESFNKSDEKLGNGPSQMDGALGDCVSGIRQFTRGEECSDMDLKVQEASSAEKCPKRPRRPTSGKKKLLESKSRTVDARTANRERLWTSNDHYSHVMVGGRKISISEVRDMGKFGFPRAKMVDAVYRGPAKKPVLQCWFEASGNVELMVAMCDQLGEMIQPTENTLRAPGTYRSSPKKKKLGRLSTKSLKGHGEITANDDDKHGMVSNSVETEANMEKRMGVQVPREEKRQAEKPSYENSKSEEFPQEKENFDDERSICKDARGARMAPPQYMDNVHCMRDPAIGEDKPTVGQQAFNKVDLRMNNSDHERSRDFNYESQSI